MTTMAANMNGTQPTLGELGYEALRPPTGGNMALGDGAWTMPHYQTFVSFMNTMSRSYWWTFDEALNDSQCNADAMRNDLVIRDALASRYRSVVTLEALIKPRNAANRGDVAGCEKVTKLLHRAPYLQQLKRNLMEAVFFGKYGVQLLCKWGNNPQVRDMEIVDWYPVHGDKIVFKWDRTPGILINPAYRGVSWENTERGPAHFLTPKEQESFVWHEFEQEDSSYYQPELAGQVHGSGMRGRIYWYWWLKQNAQKFLMNFLKKAGNGFLLVSYPSGNTSAKAAAQRAIEGQDGNNVIYVPVDLKNGETIDKVITHIPVQMTGAQLQWTVITGINALIRASILGETLTTGASNTGMGSNLGMQHGMTADERKKYDATDLETPMQKIVNMLFAYNCPTMMPGKYEHLIDKRNPQETMNAVGTAMQVGLAVPQGWFQDELGIPSPVNGEPVLAQVQPMQATAVSNTPAGTPMVGGAGSPPQGGSQPQQGAPQ